MSIKDGGPAFPLDERTALLTMEHATGMSLRDYFAAKAMQGMCAHFDNWGLMTDEIAKKSYVIADAMLRARSA